MSNFKLVIAGPEAPALARIGFSKPANRSEDVCHFVRDRLAGAGVGRPWSRAVKVKPEDEDDLWDNVPV